MSEPNAWRQWDGPQHAAPPPAPPRRRRRWPWVVLVIVLLLGGGCAAFAGLFVNSVSDEVSKTVRVTYEVTGDAKDAAISYTTWRDGDMLTSEESSRDLPWRKVVTTEGFIKGGSLSVTLGADGGRATCSVTVDDGTPRTATASGPFATASCEGF
ncbi:hypothetical protein [Streptomyces sp. AM8-1-1]|uniref:hypothetical protein n=1 Tax=Streptomyces sp. AM8-1-1 TaxID=3075825 RepID=UPI0028C4DCBA|nr:hypothetical protein [Streptomyces sp. AM8-1-1]WNO74987.1 hypothetical protein RPQ07_26745 [Streptomyces sp. AM8-1-1]